MSNTVNVQAVINVLSGKVASLVTENAVLQAQNAELGERVQQLQAQLDKTKNHKKEKQPAE